MYSLIKSQKILSGVVALFAVAFLVLPQLAAAISLPSAGPSAPSVTSDDASVGSLSWSSTDSAKVSDNAYALAVSPGAGPQQTHYLTATGFGFSIPTNATIKGIQVTVERTTNSTSVKDTAVYLMKSSSTVGTNYAATSGTGFTACISPVTGSDCWSTSEATVTYGGSSDLWGTTWTPAEINDSGTGVAFSATRTYGTGSRNIQVDQIMMTVYYDEAPVIDAHGDEAVEVVYPNSATVNYTAPDAVDDIDGTFSATCLPASGSIFSYGDTTVYCDASDSSGNNATQTSFTVTVQDTTGPSLAVVTPIGTTESHQPDVTFSTDEDGTLAVGGGCSSTATTVTAGNNTIPFGFLASGTYSACTITVTDGGGNASVLAVPEFTISNAAPASGGGGGGGGNGSFSLVNNNSDLGTQPGSVLGAFTTQEEQSQQSQEQQGAVLGASTNALAASCSADKHLLTSNLGMGKSNSVEQVKLLQQFLNQELGANLPISGAFGDMTLASVKAFQAAHTADVLTPWGITDPTGYVGVTTRRMIDILVCGADYAIPQLPN